MSDCSANNPGEADSSGMNAWLSEVIQEHGDQAWALALAIVGRVADAEDVLQESLLKLLRKAKQEPIRNPWAYLNVVLKTTALDVLAKRHTHNPSRTAAGNPQETEHIDDPSEAMEIQEFSVLLDMAIARLPKRLAKVIISRELCQQPYSQIAEEMGITPKTVRIYRCRAMRRLQEILCQE